jgi:hypothetical protein
MVAYSWKQLQSDVVLGKTELIFSRTPSMQTMYHNARQYVSTLHFRKYSDYIKIKHLGFSTRICKDGTLSARKTRGSLCSLFIENEYPYAFVPEDNIKHYMIWSLTPLGNEDVNHVIRDNNYEHSDYVWFVNDVANQSIKDLWHCHVLIKL